MHHERIFEIQVCGKCECDRFTLGFLDPQGVDRKECYICQISQKVVNERRDLNADDPSHRLEVESAARSMLGQYQAMIKREFPQSDSIPTGLYQIGSLLARIDQRLNVNQSRASQRTGNGESSVTLAFIGQEQETPNHVHFTNGTGAAARPNKEGSAVVSNSEGGPALRECIRCHEKYYKREDLAYFATRERGIDLTKTCIQCRLFERIKSYIANEGRAGLGKATLYSTMETIMKENVDPYLQQWFELGVNEKPPGYFGTDVGEKELEEIYEIVRMDAQTEVFSQVEDSLKHRKEVAAQQQKSKENAGSKRKRTDDSHENLYSEPSPAATARPTRIAKSTPKNVSGNSSKKSRSEPSTSAQPTSSAKSSSKSSQANKNTKTSSNQVRELIGRLRSKSKKLDTLYCQLEDFTLKISAKFCTKLTITDEGMADAQLIEEKLDALIESINGERCS